MAEFLEFGKVYQQVGRKAVEELGLARISNPGWEDIKGEKLAYFLNEDQATFLGTLTRNSEYQILVPNTCAKDINHKHMVKKKP